MTHTQALLLDGGSSRRPEGRCGIRVRGMYTSPRPVKALPPYMTKYTYFVTSKNVKNKTLFYLALAIRLRSGRHSSEQQPFDRYSGGKRKRDDVLQARRAAAVLSESLVLPEGSLQNESVRRDTYIRLVLSPANKKTQGRDERPRNFGFCVP